MSAAMEATRREPRRSRRRAPAGGAPAKRLTALELGEVSCVDVPANSGARHLMFKNLAAVAEKRDPEEREAALLARCADLQHRLAERDAQIAHLADKVAELSLEDEESVSAPAPAPASAPAEKAVGADVEAIIRAAAEAAVAKARVDLAALRDRATATAERVEREAAVAKMASGAAGPDDVAEAVELAKADAPMPPDYWRRALRALGDQLAPDLDPSSRLQKALGTPEGRAILAASSGDRRVLRAGYRP